MKRHPFRANGSEFADSAFSNIAATFFQCLSLIVSKLSTWEKKTKKNTKFRQGLLVKHIKELAKISYRFVGFRCFTLVGGVGNDRSIADCIFVKVS